MAVHDASNVHSTAAAPHRGAHNRTCTRTRLVGHLAIHRTAAAAMMRVRADGSGGLGVMRAEVTKLAKTARAQTNTPEGEGQQLRAPHHGGGAGGAGLGVGGVRRRRRAAGRGEGGSEDA
jgi:hypothetical protein